MLRFGNETSGRSHFFVNVQSENNFDHSLIEKPEHLLIWICEKAGSEIPRNGMLLRHDFAMPSDTHFL